MPGIEISALPPIVGPSSLTDVLPTDQTGPLTGKVTNQQLLTLFQTNGQALTKNDDTNVTLTLGGSPGTALLNATSLTLGWTGTLPGTRGGTGVNNGASTITLGGSLTTVGAFASTFTMTNTTNVTFPTSGTLATTAGASGIVSPGLINQLAYYAAAGSTVSGLATLNNGVLVTSNTGVPSLLANSGTAGFVLTANSGAPPSWQSVSVSGAIETINGDTGSVTPTAGTVTISGGTTGLTTSGSSSTLNLTGVLKLANGGTNANLTANNGGIFYSTATAGAILSGTATANQVLLSGSSTTPAWSTATYPATTTINQVLYSSSANVIGGISAVNSAVMISSGAGVPSFSTTLPSGLTIPGYQATITPAALTKTDDTNVTLTLGGTPSTALLQATSLALGWTGQLAVARGGTGLASTTAYAVLCGGTTTTGALQSIASVGTSGQVLTSNGAGALPTFQATSTAYHAPTIQKFTSSSGTYTTPTSPAPLYIRVSMVGGGGGGFGTGTSGVGTATAGGNTTFGTTLLVANGGSGAAGAGGAAGGTTSLGAAIGYSQTGMSGIGGGTAVNANGGAGGISFFSGSGSGGGPGGAGNAAIANSGSGGGGAGGSASFVAAGGGGAGGYVDAIISSPSATYSYAVGGAGGGSTAGAGGSAGANGAAGLIVVYEFYQ